MTPSKAGVAAIASLVAAMWAAAATAQQIAYGVACTSAKLGRDAQGRVVIHDRGGCNRADHHVQVLAVDLSRAQVEPVMSGPRSLAYPVRSLGTLAASQRRSSPPQNAVAAVNGGFFYPYSGMVDNLSWVVDIGGVEHGPASMRIDQQCRASRRWQLALTQSGRVQLPTIQPQRGPGGPPGTRILGGGGRILPVADSGTPLPSCPCSRGQPCDSSPQPDPNWNGRAARTAIGFKVGELPPRLYIVTVRNPPGIAIPQLSVVFRAMTGADQAIALDGGGSTQMWIRDNTSGRSLTFGGSRPLVSALVVYADAAAAIPRPPPSSPPPARLACDPHRPPVVRDRRAWCDYGRCVGQARAQGAIGERDSQRAHDAAWNATRTAPFTHGHDGGACSVY